ncbi:MAG: bifunctional phosphoribosylaminoimidazolecarboxamide formyltransferase/IMP cyclohydrolase [Gemmatimonadetes bacterium]|nr:bifunctional phosphoribosylaminoimidazolecarboxamide formyltransferase/IMP cyclohydrolase [Gemmatimonadota bacterium]NNK64433.1 bifunctional phosphoribosylaminoimidazolecarboxamide formyltransferase/IMP cyclohydrolase [Gemmatimonadota bacterium]
MSRPRALLSVSDKSGIVDLGRALVERGFELVSTGGTARALREAGLEVTSVSDITGHPEMMDGRVKTLHPAVHAGLLARRNREDDLRALAEQGYGPIDLVAVNLYPFRETVARGGVPVGEAMGKVDIGGPTMIRAAAKNHTDVWVVVDPDDYAAVLGVLDGQSDDESALRRRLAAKVFRHISGYDAAVAAYLDGDDAAAPFTAAAASVSTLRYGENPDQEAVFYRLGDTPTGIAALEQLHGKALSYNNLLDLDGALLTLAPFAYSPKPAVAIIKHTTPCGLAVGPSLAEAYDRALATDPVSSFGSVIAVNRSVDLDTAERLSKLFVECLVAPGFDDDALEVLTRKKNVRLLVAPAGPGGIGSEPDSGGWADAGEDVRGMGRFLAAHSLRPDPRVFRSVYGGVLAQSPPRPPFYGVAGESWAVATERTPSEAEWDDLRFAWAAVFGVKSNAILLARGGATLGIGAGQMSRVDASRIAVQKAADADLDLAGSVLASDAFFPFRDGVDAAAEAGVRAIVQPGGSKRDAEVIEAANEHGIAMVLTGRRLFRH